MENIVSELLKEAKPYYFKKKRQKQVVQSAASMLGVFLVVFALSFNAQEYQYTSEAFDEVAFGSVISEQGFAVDEYGLLEV